MRQVGLDAVAITDHNAITGALELARHTPFLVIVGEEIMTSAGEIMGLFLEEHIPPGLSPVETAQRIKAQGGLVGVPHPFDRLRRSRLKESAWSDLLPLVDLIEVFNARTHLARDGQRACRFAQEHGLLQGAGSDSHSLGELGRAYVELPPFSGPKEFRRALAQGRVVGRQASLLVHLRSTLAKLRSRP
ncbi:MAG: PHP domain-containing protein [Chloroflexi bacterium]|nr:PHP domain-containing protein [Chloroflexota bacterium]